MKVILGMFLEELACSEVTPQLSASRGNSFCLRSIEVTVGDYQGMCPIAFRLQQLAQCIVEYRIKIKGKYWSSACGAGGGAPKDLGL